MKNAQVEIPARRHLDQNVQKAHRIRAAGHRHADALARLEHMEAFDRFQHPSDHSPDSNSLRFAVLREYSCSGQPSIKYRTRTKSAIRTANAVTIPTHRNT